MLKLTFRNLLAHKRRLVGTFLAVVIGVAFFTGVTTLTATVNRTFNDLFSNGNKGTDAYVRSSSKIELDQGPGMATMRDHIDASLVDTVRQIDGVADARPFIQGTGRIITASGEALGNPDQGPPVFAEAWIDDPNLNGWSVVDGRGPSADGEVVINRQAAKDGNVHVGDKVSLAPEGIQLTVVGIATYAGQDSSGGTTYAGLTVEQAERDVLKAPGKIDGIKVVAANGLSQQQLVERIAPALPKGVEVITGAALVKELQDDIQQQFLQAFNIFLTVFALIALVVAVFSIYNTFSIIVAQRTREMALLRAVGAGRTQVLRAVLFEAGAVGVVASVVGVAVGALLALGLRAGMSAAGFGLPSSSFAFGPGNVISGVLVGLVVTLFASMFPAVKATRIPPLAAMREVAIERTTASRVRAVIGALFLLAGVAFVMAGALGTGDNRPLQAGLGTFLLLVGMVVFGPLVARQASDVIGSPLPRLRGTPGRLAHQNAMRNPRRTSASAMALMIGVAVIALFTIFAASLKATFNGQIDKQVAGDLVATSGFGTVGMNPALVGELAQQPQVAAVSGFRFGAALIDGQSKSIQAGDPAAIAKVMHLTMKEGALADLSSSGIAVSENVAHDHGWHVGSPVTVHFIDGTDVDVTVRAIYGQSQLLGNYVLSLDLWAQHAPESSDTIVAIKLKDGVDAQEAKTALEPIVDRIAPGASFYTKGEFADRQGEEINQMLIFISFMLLAAIIISLMGIANTLSLSINERTREIGLSRAVGMLRGQLRAMVRWEGALIALFGTVGGLVLGIIGSWALVRSTGAAGLVFKLPIGSLVVYLVIGGLFGVVSALLPANRAARLNVLSAIAQE